MSGFSDMPLSLAGLNQTLVDSIDRGIIYFHADGTILTANPAAQKTIKKTVAEMQGKRINDLFDCAFLVQGLPISLEPELLTKIATSGQSIDNLIIEVKEQNTLVSRWFRISGFPQFDSSGKTVTHVIMMFENVTAIHLAAERLRTSEMTLKLFVEYAPASIAMFDRDMRYLAVSRRYLSDYRLVDTNVIGRSHYDVFPEISERVKRIYQHCLTGAVECAEDGQFKRQNGEIDWVRWEVRPWYVHDDQVGGIILFSEVITARRQAEEALKDAQRRLLLATRSAKIGLWELDLRTNTETYSSEWASLLGYTDQEVDDNHFTWLDFLHPDDRGQALAIEQRFIDHPWPDYSNEFRMRHKDGSYHWFVARAVLIQDDHGRPIQLVGTNIDITQRKQAEKEIEDLLERFDLAARAAHLGVWDWDILQNNLLWDDRMYELYGGAREADSETYETWLRSLHPDDRESSDEITQQAIRGERSYETEFRIVLPDGTVRWLQSYGQVIRDAQGKPIRMIGINYDITARKEADEKISRQAHQMKILADASRVFSATELNTQMLLEQVARQVVEALGDNCQVRLSDGHSQQLSLAAMYDVDPEHLAYAWQVEEVVSLGFGNDGFGMRALSSCQPVFMQYLDSEHPPDNISPEFRSYLVHFPIHSLIVVPLCELGQPVGLLSVLRYRDGQPPFIQEEFELVQELALRASLAISSKRLFEQVQAELYARQQAEQALQSERDSLARRVEERTAELRLSNAELMRASRAKDEFLSTMSHELRTPLNGVLNLSESLQEGIYGPLAPRQSKIVATIYESGEHLLNLINDILDVSKAESGRMELNLEPVETKMLLDSVLHLITPQTIKKHLRLSTSIDITPSVIIVDARRVKQMLVNLLGNAVKFTPEGGQIGIDVNLEEDRKAIRFSVWDTGIGIPANKQDLLFQPFVQLDSALARQYTGTGLGLALVRRMAELHGGAVGVKSELGKGSTFWFTIPLPEVMTVQVFVPEEEKNLPRVEVMAPKRALIIEDSPDAAEYAARLLRELNTEVIISPTGEEVLLRVEQIRPEVILLDLLLPVTSGWQVLEQLKASPLVKGIPVVILSVVDERTRGLAAGAVAYLLKPFSREDLYTAVLKAIQPAGAAICTLVSRPARALAPTHLTADQAPPLVLVVEDHKQNQDIFVDYLEANNYRVIPAANGQEALKYSMEFLPDLILMDIQMPGMDGLEAIQRLRMMPEFTHTPIIALTALAMPGDRERCLAAGANAYLTKPVNLKRLLSEIEALLPGKFL